MSILSSTEGISVINLNQKDIVRHKLVTKIVTAYEAFDKKKSEKNDSINLTK